MTGITEIHSMTECMKNIVVIVLLVLSFSSCGKTAKPPPKSKPQRTTTAMRTPGDTGVWSTSPGLPWGNGGVFSTTPLPPTDFGGIFSTTPLPPTDFGGIFSTTPLPPTDFGGIFSTTPLPPTDFGGIFSTTKLPPTDFVGIFSSTTPKPKLTTVNDGVVVKKPTQPSTPADTGVWTTTTTKLPPTDFGGIFSTTPLPPTDFGGIFSTTPLPPTDFGGIFSTTKLPPTDFVGIFSSTTPLPPTDFGGIFSTTPLPPTDFGGIFSTTPLPPTDFGGIFSTTILPPTDFVGIFSSTTTKPKLTTVNDGVVVKKPTQPSTPADTGVWTTTTTQPTNTTLQSTTTAVETTTIQPVTTPLPDIYYGKLLLKTFLSGKDVKIRPSMTQSTPIPVKTRFFPEHVIEFDSSSQKFCVIGHIFISWKDDGISWNIDHYNDLKMMLVPQSNIWTPNIRLQKAYSGNGAIGHATDQIRIGRTGHTQWVPDKTFCVICDVDIRYYPFDEQICKIVYYAADETVDTLILSHDKDIDLKYLNKSQNAAWMVRNVTKTRVLKNNNYHIEISFHMKRRPNYTTFTLIVPLLMLACLNVAMFLVPIESGEKGGFAITIFLAYGIFVSIMSDKLPHNSLQTSFFIVFITSLLLLSVVTVLYSVVQSKLVLAISTKDVLFGCFRISSPKAAEFATEPAIKSMSWSEFFRKLDIAIFVTFLVIALLLAFGFFVVIILRIDL